MIKFSIHFINNLFTLKGLNLLIYMKNCSLLIKVQILYKCLKMWIKVLFYNAFLEI